MTTLAVSGRRVKSTLTPTRRTVVLFDATQRHPAPRDFGRGILRSMPNDRVPFTAADAAWAAEAFSRPVSTEDIELERRAQEAAWLDSYCRGVLLL
jgi:hypothetical protein